MRYRVKRKTPSGTSVEAPCGKKGAEVWLLALAEKNDEIFDRNVHIKFFVSRKGEQILEINTNSEVRIKVNDVS